jgi:esterase/lipase superfamily enzyme
MHRVYHRWDSPSLGRPMELLVFGHAGPPVVVFPTSQGRFFEYEDRGMVGALADQIERGWLQLYCVDSVDAESWYCGWAHPRGRVARHDQYERYILDEVLPLARSQNPNHYVIAHGCSFGASHAMLFGLRHPAHFSRVVAFSGYYDMRTFTGGYFDDEIYYHNPLDFIAHLHDGALADQIRRLQIVMAIGRDDSAAWTNTALSDSLWRKGVWHAMRWWDGWAHDWPFWHRMARHYIHGPD